MGRKKKITYVAVQLSADKHKYVASTRYLSSIDDKWYETTDKPLFIFNEKDIPTIKKQLKNCFRYQAAFLYEDGHEEVWNLFTKKEKGKLIMGSLAGVKLTYNKKA